MFDDDHAVGDIEIALVAMLSEKLCLVELAEELVDLLPFPRTRVATLMHAMVAGANCIDDTSVLRSASTAEVLEPAKAQRLTSKGQSGNITGNRYGEGRDGLMLGAKEWLRQHDERQEGGVSDGQAGRLKKVGKRLQNSSPAYLAVRAISEKAKERRSASTTQEAEGAVAPENPTTCQAETTSQTTREQELIEPSCTRPGTVTDESLSREALNASAVASAQSSDSVVSAFERHAKASWRVARKTAGLIGQYHNYRQSKPFGTKVKDGCLALSFFWVPFVIPLLVYSYAFFAVIAVVVYASLVTLAWGIATGVTRLRNKSR